MADLTVTDVSAGIPATSSSPQPGGDPNVQMPPPNTSAAQPFVPLNPPPSDHHPLNTGLGTELGDTPKSMMDKINAGFEHIYAVLEKAGADIKTAVDPAQNADQGSQLHGIVESALGDVRDWVAKTFVSFTDHAALASKVTEVEQAVKQAAPDLSGFVAKADFDALKASHDAMANQFTTLADRIETFLGLKK